MAAPGRIWLIAGLAALALVGCSKPGGREVDAARLAAAADSPGDWLTNGRTYAEDRYSPLDQITGANVDRLGLAWEQSLESRGFGVEATPLVVDGTLYVTSTWSRVFAFDAATGKRLWAYDPQVRKELLRTGCCKAVNRGVAFWKGKVYVGAFDGRLIALDAKTGEPVWSADTTGGAKPYTITGAPRVVKGKVVIGNGGGDYGARGFFSAYDAETGKLAWRFFTVPGDPRKPFEHPELAAAAKTWDPNRDWSIGGGGTVWDSFSYDPQLNLLYVGVGNAGPYNQKVRNPGGGDQLYVSSILAVNPDTGRLAWHYQTTPGDNWDFTATQNMVLTDLTIGGRKRQVLMQAPKNGFFYVLDRKTGELLAADKYARVNWASHVDLKTGRPAATPAGDYSREARLVFPSAYGAHNWQPMAFNPKTGLVYIPARDLGWVWGAETLTWFYEGADLATLTKDDVRKATTGVLIGWDPVARKPRWTAPQPTLMSGGVLTTAGDLVVQGTQDGWIEFRDTASGKLLRRIFVGTGMVAPPVSYAVDGVQYIAIAAGWHGVRTAPDPAGAPPPRDNAGRLIVLKLDGGEVSVAPVVEDQPFLAGVGAQPADLVATGKARYQRYCGGCHGLFGERSVLPDLRRMSPETYEAFDDIVLGGAYKEGGMASFADVLTPDDSRAIRAYVADWASRSAAGLRTEAGAAGRAK
ncbi:PQQ-dependent dehydrogenase, methanol/ethanol family [Phenylobacterium sp.]|uniref:PQQ-dependent dehydrogenase, methanol/ethanol family n=1 Tax=Phenylobacterium sp. TaxID=1871053 RepID=UPI002FC5DADB